jgi:hypothetical protein
MWSQGGMGGPKKREGTRQKTENRTLVSETANQVCNSLSYFQFYGCDIQQMAPHKPDSRFSLEPKVSLHASHLLITPCAPHSSLDARRFRGVCPAHATLTLALTLARTLTLTHSMATSPRTTPGRRSLQGRVALSQAATRYEQVMPGGHRWAERQLYERQTMAAMNVDVDGWQAAWQRACHTLARCCGRLGSRHPFILTNELHTTLTGEDGMAKACFCSQLEVQLPGIRDLYRMSFVDLMDML